MTVIVFEQGKMEADFTTWFWLNALKTMLVSYNLGNFKDNQGKQ